MTRIPDTELTHLKQTVSLLSLVRSSGTTLKKHGKDYLGLCPFHDDKEPSLVISPAKNLWNCLGACGEGGDVIEWLMKRQGVSFRHAVALLKGGELAVPVSATPVTGAHPPGAPAYCPSMDIKRNTTAKHVFPLAANCSRRHSNHTFYQIKHRSLLERALLSLKEFEPPPI